MNHCFSTFKSINDKQQNNVIVGDLNLQSAKINIPKQIDKCDEYDGFLEELKKIHEKVDSGDLSDFTELKLWTNTMQIITSCQDFLDNLKENNYENILH